MIHQAIELGVTLFDTSDAYGPRTNEELLGAALAGGRRDAVVLATQGRVRPQVGSYVPVPDGRPSVLLAGLDDYQLRRLQTDPRRSVAAPQGRPDGVPIEESVGTMG